MDSEKKDTNPVDAANRWIHAKNDIVHPEAENESRICSILNHENRFE